MDKTISSDIELTTIDKTTPKNYSRSSSEIQVEIPESHSYDDHPPKGETQDFMIVLNKNFNVKETTWKDSNIKYIMGYIILSHTEEFENAIDKKKLNWEYYDDKEKFIELFVKYAQSCIDTSTKFTKSGIHKQLVGILMEILVNRCNLEQKCFQYNDNDNQEYYVFKIRANNDVLFSQAETMKLSLKLKYDDKTNATNNYKDYKYCPYPGYCEFHTFKNENKLKTQLKYYRTQPYDKQLIALNKFNNLKSDELQFGQSQHDKNNDNTIDDRNIFRQLDRIRLIQNIINDEINLGWLKNNKLIVKAGPLHFLPDQNKLKVEASFGKMHQLLSLNSLNNIYNQQGEQIAFYQQYLNDYNKALIFAGIIGIILQLLIVIGYQVKVFQLTQTLFIIVWSSVFLEYWKRKQNFLQCIWKCKDIQGTEGSLPTFEGNFIQDPYYEKIKEKAPPAKQFLKLCLSFLSTGTFILCTITSVACIFLFRYQCLTGQFGKMGFLAKHGPKMVGVMSTINIKIMAFIYSQIAIKTTNQENHEYYIDWENSQVIKLFLFSFINNQNGLFYISFIKMALFKVVKGECLKQLQTTLTMQFLTMAIIDIIQIIIPYLIAKYKEIKKSYGKLSLHSLSLYRKQTTQKSEQLLEKKIPNQSVSNDINQQKYVNNVNDFMRLVIQFGQIVIFSVAFPVIPLFSIFLNVFKVRATLYRFILSTERTDCKIDDGIGIWGDLLNLMCIIGLISNLGLIFQTINLFDGFSFNISLPQSYSKFEENAITDINTISSKQSILILFLIIENASFVLKWFIDVIIPDEPEIVKNYYIKYNEVANKSLTLQNLDPENKINYSSLAHDEKDDESGDDLQIDYKIYIGEFEEKYTEHTIEDVFN